MLLDVLLRQIHLAQRIAAALWRRAGMVTATRLHRATLGSVGAGTRFQQGVRFADPGNVTIGADCYFWRGCDASAEIKGAALIIDDGVQINRDVHLDTTGGLTLCAGVLVSEGAIIYTHDHGLDPRSVPEMIPKTIADDVWIGARAVIMPQCRRIGRGAIVGAGAVVTRDVPAGSIVVGNPARVVGQRETPVGIAA